MGQLSDSVQDAARWKAVLERDTRFDGAFVYGVLSTRIFCRPTCPSRRPKREGARLFGTPRDATDAGFRACKRCRPEEQSSAQSERVAQARLIIESRVSEGEPVPPLAELARRVGASAGHLQRTFKSAVGLSPREYAESLRVAKLKGALRGAGSVLNAQLSAGYNSSRAMYESAPASLGMTPSEYKKGGKGTQILFRVEPCELGFLLAAATARGVCAASLGDSRAQLEADLRSEFPTAQIAEATEDNEDFAAWMASLKILARGNPLGDGAPEIPTDVRATEFQHKVWAALRQIRRGETRTYAQVAEALGRPSAVRAVARACATNPVALAVPCHRVVRGDGSLAGYRWGVERKKTLLEREKNLS